METLFTLFVFGSFWFWALILFASIVLCVCSEREQGVKATLTIVVTLLVLQFLGDLNLLAYLLNHPLKVLSLVAGYFVAGSLWSVAKWYFYLLRKKEEYEKAKKVYGSEFGMWEKTPAYEEMRRLVKGGAGAKKRKIVTWMTFWPWNLVWTFIDDFVMKVFDHIFRVTRELYERMFNRALGGIKKDFPM